MFKDPRVKHAEEMLDVLEDKDSSSGLVGGFIAICIGISIGSTLLQQVKNELN